MKKQIIFFKNKNLFRVSQVKMLETLFVSIIFIFIFIFSFLAYSRYQMNQLSQENINSQIKQAEINFLRFYSLPEISCGITSSGSQSNGLCIDVYKAIVFANLTNISRNADSDFSKYYQNLLGYGIIELKILQSPQKSIIIYNNTVKSKQNVKVVEMPILVYNATSDSNYLGNVIFKVYY